MGEREQPELGKALQSIRTRKRFTRALLARAAGVSGAYIGLIEDGYDSRTGKPVQPSPETLRKLADALGDGDPEDANQVYADLMRSAGYLNGVASAGGRLRVQEPSNVKPPLHVITRGVRDNPDIPVHVQRAIIELLELTEELNRRASGNE